MTELLSIRLDGRRRHDQVLLDCHMFKYAAPFHNLDQSAPDGRNGVLILDRSTQELDLTLRYATFFGLDQA